MRDIESNITLPVNDPHGWVGMKEMEGTVKSKDPSVQIIRELFPDSRCPPIRSSAISCFEHCPRKFLYQCKLGLQPKSYSSALHLGRVFHLVLQSLFTGADREVALNAAHGHTVRQTAKVLAGADPGGFLPSGETVDQVLATIDEDYNKGRAMAAAFMEFVPFDWSKWEVLETPDGLPCVELLLQTKIAGIAAPLIAPCDLALLKKGTRDVWIVDHKTTSMKTLARARSVRISSQIALYRLVLQAHLDSWFDTLEGIGEPRLRVVGSIHNIVQKPTIKYCPKTKDKDGFDHYIQRVHTWYKEKHEANAGSDSSSPILQTATAFTDPVLGMELYLRLQQQSRAGYSNPDLNRFYRAGDYACQTFNHECPYADLCSSAPATWLSIIERKFDIVHREDEEENE
jgi:hypothetical protein